MRMHSGLRDLSSTGNLLAKLDDDDDYEKDDEVVVVIWQDVCMKVADYGEKLIVVARRISDSPGIV